MWMKRVKLLGDGLSHFTVTLSARGISGALLLLRYSSRGRWHMFVGSEVQS